MLYVPVSMFLAVFRKNVFLLVPGVRGCWYRGQTDMEMLMSTAPTKGVKRIHRMPKKISSDPSDRHNQFLPFLGNERLYKQSAHFIYINHIQT